ncbi:SDR family oxidoreductase [Mucilaginibacter agri]|uniref:NAD-dependent epimerase/dehydratase family protein n=1 Tax=Mucilaginibacter agri TaxID=2695265 RepID=A0A965ZGW0_9SPHI|nr:SDR family oxidoreductase [Mucilaginibacter agri]NCD70833.1 NAD-dependent epimerase/dehydratase family protein [Mucilaginibacter agri]
MRVFVTGATGFIGSAIVKELIAAGHTVLGLTRSEEGAKALEAAGAEVHHGTLQDLESLRSGAAACDGVIHTAFIHDFSKFQENCDTDRGVIAALASALEGTNRPLIVTSGTGLGAYAPGEVAVEDNVATSKTTHHPRVASEEAAALAAAKGVNVSIMRLPPSVHDKGDHGFVPMLIGIARDKGSSAYVNEGAGRWPAVHRLDAAHLYRLVLEKGVSGTYHAVGDTGVPTRQIAEVIGKHLNLPVKSVTPEEAATHFGWFSGFFASDVPASAKLTSERTGWQPTHIGLLEDMESNYFES